METRYHINPATGNANKCRAKIGNCPYKGEDGKESPHYSTKEQAAAAYEAAERRQTLPPALKATQGVTPGLSSVEALTAAFRENSLREVDIDDLPEDVEVENLLREMDSFPGEIYPGTFKEVTEKEGGGIEQRLKNMAATAASLVSFYLDEDGSFDPPSTYDDWVWSDELEDYYAVERAEAPPGFRFVGAGAEANAYVHEATNTVYKVPNAEGVGSAWSQDASDLQRDVMLLSQKAYALLDNKVLEEKNIEYAETQFLDVQDASGVKVPMTVQPYLSPEEYEPIDLPREQIDELERSQPLYDMRDANMVRNKATGRIVMFDCLYLPLHIDI